MRISDWSSDVCSSYLIFLDPLTYITYGNDTLAELMYVRAGLTAVDARARPDWGFIMEERGEVEGDPAKPRFVVDRSEEHTSELQSLMRISYAVFCLKKKIINTIEIEHDAALHQ